MFSRKKIFLRVLIKNFMDIMLNNLYLWGYTINYILNRINGHSFTNQFMVRIK
jgi:hypothetical protein